VSATSITVRTSFVRTLIGSLAGAGLLGIAALLLGSFGEVQLRILLTTVLVGAYSVLCLGALIVLGTRFAPVGIAGVTASSVALAQGLALTWVVDLDGGAAVEFLARGFGVFAILGVVLAHAALLLHPTRGQAAPGTLLRLTLGALSGVAALSCAAVLAPDVVDGGLFWRLLGVLAILDVVGTISTPLLAASARTATPVRETV
jgi:hypothetical protein